MSARISVVDDDRAFSSLAAAALQREGFTVGMARSLHEARAAIASSAADLVVLDRRLPDGDGLELVPELRAQNPDCAILMITAHGDVASAVEAIRAGAVDYLTKPVELADVVLKVKRALEDSRLRERLHRVEAELSSRRRLVPPRSDAMKKVLDILERVAATPRSPVLLLGETGVGKEVLARHLHERSVGSAAPFIHVNCAALPETTVESELFGHERGAFTDARTAKRGLAEVANGGSLFLDEVGELSASLQAKLLTFLDSGRFRRLGSATEQSSTARIIAATNRSLPEEIRAGRFREDLWFRLSVFRLEVPALRNRRDDIPLLAESILSELRAELGRRTAVLGAAARRRLARYAFPGNVRELRNVLERALVLEPGPELELEILEGQPIAAPGEDFRVPGSPITFDELERRYAAYVLKLLDGRRLDAAKALGVSYPTFAKRLGDTPESE